jgi:taurine dioxygenase
MHVRPITPEIGAEVTGINMKNATQEDIDQLHILLSKHSVLFLPNQAPSLTEHINFGKNYANFLGLTLQSHPNLQKHVNPLQRLVFELKASEGGVANEWHTDLTFQTKPARMSILHMVQCPQVGGDTMWASLGAAYDALSPPMQDMLENLTALHDATPHNKPEVTAIHPVIRVHPDTGRKCLYVSEHFTRRIVELEAKESKSLLELLTEHVKDPRFNVRYHWTPGTVALWDNTCTQHCVLNNFTGERHIQRVTIAGDEVHGVHSKKKASPMQYNPAVSGLGAGAQSRHDRQLFVHLKREDEMPGVAGGYDGKQQAKL